MRGKESSTDCGPIISPFAHSSITASNLSSQTKVQERMLTSGSLYAVGHPEVYCTYDVRFMRGKYYFMCLSLRHSLEGSGTRAEQPECHR